LTLFYIICCHTNKIRLNIIIIITNHKYSELLSDNKTEDIQFSTHDDNSTFQQHLTAISEAYVDTEINKRRYSIVKCIEIYTDIKFQHGHDETK
jgi:hypothetical protein